MRLASPVNSASRASAIFMRTIVGINGGTMGDLTFGRRDTNLMKTWFTMEAWSGLIHKHPEAPEIYRSNRENGGGNGVMTDL